MFPPCSKTTWRIAEWTADRFNWLYGIPRVRRTMNACALSPTPRPTSSLWPFRSTRPTPWPMSSTSGSWRPTNDALGFLSSWLAWRRICATIRLPLKRWGRSLYALWRREKAVKPPRMLVRGNTTNAPPWLEKGSTMCLRRLLERPCWRLTSAKHHAALCCKTNFTFLSHSLLIWQKTFLLFLFRFALKWRLGTSSFFTVYLSVLSMITCAFEIPFRSFCHDVACISLLCLMHHYVLFFLFLCVIICSLSVYLSSQAKVRISVHLSNAFYSCRRQFLSCCCSLLASEMFDIFFFFASAATHNNIPLLMSCV